MVVINTEVYYPYTVLVSFSNGWSVVLSIFLVQLSQVSQSGWLHEVMKIMMRVVVVMMMMIIFQEQDYRMHVIYKNT